MPTLSITLLHVWIFPIEEKLSEWQIPAAFFIHFHIFFHHRNLSRRIASDPTFMESSNMLNILQSLFFLLPFEWDLKTDEMENMALLWKQNKQICKVDEDEEKCFSRLKPRSIWTLRLHTSVCASVERAKIFSPNQNFFCLIRVPPCPSSIWSESPHVD